MAGGGPGVTAVPGPPSWVPKQLLRPRTPGRKSREMARKSSSAGPLAEPPRAPQPASRPHRASTNSALRAASA